MLINFNKLPSVGDKLKYTEDTITIELAIVISIDNNNNTILTDKFKCIYHLMIVMVI